MSEKETQTNESRRDFIKKATYTAPVVMTMAAMPSLAAAGSVNSGPIPGLPDDNQPG
jgi:hypothetical protein